jgi:hypothetical protein
LDGPKPPFLNVVATIYRWCLGRYARNKTNTPLDIERRLGTSSRGKPWPRLAVPFVLGIQNLEIIGVTAVPGVLAIFLSQRLESVPILATALDLAGTYVTLLPVALLVVLSVWCLLPERRTGGFLLHPQRLWPPSVATLLANGFIAWLVWEVARAPAT